MKESWRRKWKVVRKWNVIVWKGILFLFSVSWHHSTLLQTHWASVSLKSFPLWFVFVYVLKCFWCDTWHYHWKCLCCGLLLLYRGDNVPWNFAPHPILHSEFEWTIATQQLTLSLIGVADSGYFPLDHSSTNTADTDTPSLLLHDVDCLRVRNSTHYVIRDALCSENFFVNQIVHDPRHSWTEVWLYIFC